MAQYSRRQFLGVLGASVAASTGLTQAAVAQDRPVVEMGNNYFDPIGLHVEPGTTVRFELAAGAHSATAYPDRIPDGTSVFDSGTITEGSYEHTFETPGTYDYYCIPHKSAGMVGRIVVGSPGGPAEESPIPDGEVPASELIVEEGAIAYGADVDGSGDAGDSTMGPGNHGMMDDRNGGRMDGQNGAPADERDRGLIGLVPFAGAALGILGLAGGGLYWLLGREGATSEPDDALATLRERYETGEIDEEEYRRRHERLVDGTDGRR